MEFRNEEKAEDEKEEEGIEGWKQSLFHPLAEPWF
jgi:hypothetical protein